MSLPQDTLDFFTVGGNLSPDAPSYVQRPADEELFQLIQSGQFCYVLASRQMGKSSLMIRTSNRLKAEGVQVVTIDLTAIGAKGVTATQWYLSLLTFLKRRLRLSINPEVWWAENEHRTLIDRFTSYIREVMLVEVTSPIVIFIDEIDTTLKLDFTDDFFAAIRSMFNARAEEPSYSRLTFVLLGVATPSDLIRDPARTPFNVGQGIDLREFSRDEAAILEEGLGQNDQPQSQAILNRIYYWTNGHPYLTQKLCYTAIQHKNGVWNDIKIDTLVETLFLTEGEQQEENLQFIRTALTQHPDKAKLLKLYQQVYDGKKIVEDRRSIQQNYLKLYGLVRTDDGVLQVRNKIYQRAFNKSWIKANTPVDRTRSLLMAAVAIIVILVGIIGYGFTNSPEQVIIEEQANLLIQSFRANQNANVRINNLAQLLELDSPNYVNEAETLFFEQLSANDRIAMFQGVDTQTIAPQLITVTTAFYRDLNNSQVENELLGTMSAALNEVDEAQANRLSTEITQWLQGRDSFNTADYEAADTIYSLVIDLNEANGYKNLGIYRDRGLARAALKDAEGALADFDLVLSEKPDPKIYLTQAQMYIQQQAFEQAVGSFKMAYELDNSLISVIQTMLENDPDLYKNLWANESTRPTLEALASAPTPTPTSTPSPPATPSPSPTPTETHTPTATAIPVDTSTPIPTPTPRNTATATPVNLVPPKNCPPDCKYKEIVPTLIEPSAGISVDRFGTLLWQWPEEYVLPEFEFFEVRIFDSTAPDAAILIHPTKETRFSMFDVGIVLQCDTEYLWSIEVASYDNDRFLGFRSLESEKRKFFWRC